MKPFDAAACAEAGNDDLSVDKLDLFLARARAQRGYVHGPGTPIATALAHLNLLDRGVPTHAAVLLFGQQPQRFMPTSELKCMHFHGTQVRKPIDSHHIYKGTVFELVDQAVDFVMTKLARRVGTRAQSTQVPVSYELPREVVVEAIVNAVAHRDYTSNSGVQVMLFADRLEVWNPGELPAPLTVAELWRPQCIDSTQPADRRAQVLRRPPDPPATEVTPEVTPEVRLVRVLVGEMTGQQLQQALGLKDDDHFRKAYLQPALDAGVIEMTVPDKPRSSRQKCRLPAGHGDRKGTNGTRRNPGDTEAGSA